MLTGLTRKANWLRCAEDEKGDRVDFFWKSTLSPFAPDTIFLSKSHVVRFGSSWNSSEKSASPAVREGISYLADAAAEAMSVSHFLMLLIRCMCWLPHSHRGVSTSLRVTPNLVNEYSTFGGTS